ncbi:PH domain-containing protein [Streptomyces sp. NPDC090106]|uniref:PH domain-containing protein n=1 Tax=Streptomyces sp. NPDC090106 TaxID=3365946 RepID=UPI003800D001
MTTKDRIYRSPAAIAGGVLLLAIIAWLGIDALFRGTDRTPWLALASMILVVPLVVAFTLRPAVFAGEDRLRVRNPFRVITLPWSQVGTFRSGYSNEVLDTSGAKFQLWAVPVSLRARKKAARKEGRAETDKVMDELRQLRETHEKAEGAQGETSVRWAYEILGPAAAGAVLLAILIALG